MLRFSNNDTTRAPSPNRSTKACKISHRLHQNACKYLMVFPIKRFRSLVVSLLSYAPKYKHCTARGGLASSRSRSLPPWAGVSNHKLRLFAARFVPSSGRAFVSSVPRSLLLLADKKIVRSWFYEEVCRWLQRRRRVVHERSYVFSPPFLVSLHMHNLFCLSVSPHLCNNTATTSLTKAMIISLLAP